MNSTLAQENESALRRTAQIPAFRRWLPVLLIFIAAAAYYGSYLRYWFNSHDESGTAVLIAQRLMAGERPWVDVEPGYNLGWFYPLVAIFKVSGVNYLVARAWFFLLSTMTALLGYGIVRRVTGSRWLGLALGLVLVAFPGSQFKNYIPLAEAANLACLISLIGVDFAKRRAWLGTAAVGGLVLGLTYLVRVEIALFFTIIWLGLLLLILLDRRLAVLRRLGFALAGAGMLAGGVVVAQTPAYLHLRGQGLEAEFWAEYSGWLSFLRGSIADEFSKAKPPAPASAALPAAAGPPATLAPEAAQEPDSDDRSGLRRRPITAMFSTPGKDRLLPFLTYAPLVGIGVFFIAGLAGVLRDLWRREFTITSKPMRWLLLIGGSLTTFPQFFFFRPDRPHLSEFMVGYILVMTACVWLLWPRGPRRSRAQALGAAALMLFLGVQFAAYATYALDHPSAGTIAARIGRKAWFHGENGVHVRCFKRQARNLQGVHDTVLQHSQPDDYLICYPYNPGFNVMTNRRTYLRNVYVDNATRSSDWPAKTIAEFEEKKPQIVVVDDRAINGTDASRFSRWAAPAHAWLQSHYTRVGHFEEVEVFARTAPTPADTTP